MLVHNKPKNHFIGYLLEIKTLINYSETSSIKEQYEPNYIKIYICTYIHTHRKRSQNLYLKVLNCDDLWVVGL